MRLPNIEKEHFFHASFENAFIGMAITDLAGVIIQSNQAFSEITGFSPEELVGKNFFFVVHPEDLKQHHEVFLDLSISSGSSKTMESRYRNMSGEIVWVRSSYSLIKDTGGSPESMLIVCVNIDEEKLAQQKAEDITKRFRFLADNMPQLIWTADGDGNLNYFSHAFYDYSGMRYEDIKNTNWEKIVYDEDLEETCAQWRHSVETGEEFLIEHRLKRRDGNFNWQFSRAMPQRDNHGKIILWVGSTSNIHRQKTVAEELEKQVLERTQDLQLANFNLKHSNHDLEQFAYIATHDLQEPLRKIRTYASWMNKKFLDMLPDEAKEYVLKIEDSSERMSVLIDDLLNYSLLLRPREEYEVTDLNLVLTNVLNDFASVITEKNATVKTADLPVLKVVPMQIYQLFYNLLSNSLKFTLEGRDPFIEIATRIITEEEIIALHLDIDLNYIEITFKDNGIGFLQEYAEKVFSIFQRLNSRKKFPGTGIGLALCQKIVAYHHGLIYAKAKENEGATIFILLPL